jgi:protease II
LDKEEKESFDVVSAGEQGIVLYREIRNRETRMEHKYQVILVDTTLNKVWEKSYYIHLRYIQIGFEYAEDYFYLLFQRNIESLKADLFVLRINLHTQNAETFLIERDYAVELTEFEVVGNTLVFGGYSNNMPTVLAYKFGVSQTIVLPGFFNERSELQHLETDDNLKTINVLVSFRTANRRKSLSLKNLQRGW